MNSWLFCKKRICSHKVQSNENFWCFSLHSSFLYFAILLSNFLAFIYLYVLDTINLSPPPLYIARGKGGKKEIIYLAWAKTTFKCCRCNERILHYASSNSQCARLLRKLIIIIYKQYGPPISLSKGLCTPNFKYDVPYWRVSLNQS